MSKIMRNGVEFTGGASAWSGTQAEYNALPIKDSTTLYFITDADGSGHNYSTDEQIVGTWIDGSKIYEKTCIFTGQFYGNITVGNISVSNLGEIVSIDGSTIANDETSKGLVFAHSNAINNMGIFIRTNGDVEFRSGSAYTASSYVAKFILTIRYTKSNS